MKVTKVPENGKNFVEYEVSGTVISFNDGELMTDLKKKERDEDVPLDVCRDYNGGLVLSTAGARTYVAGILIPARRYTETETPNPDYNPEDPGSQEYIIDRQPVPFNMDNVEITLYEEV